MSPPLIKLVRGEPILSNANLFNENAPPYKNDPLHIKILILFVICILDLFCDIFSIV